MVEKCCSILDLILMESLKEMEKISSIPDLREMVPLREMEQVKVVVMVMILV